MKNYKMVRDFEILLPMIFVKTDFKTNLLLSMLLSTISAMFFIESMPWAVPLFMASVQRSSV